MKRIFEFPIPVNLLIQKLADNFEVTHVDRGQEPFAIK